MFIEIFSIGNKPRVFCIDKKQIKKSFVKTISWCYIRVCVITYLFPMAILFIVMYIRISFYHYQPSTAPFASHKITNITRHTSNHDFSYFNATRKYDVYDNTVNQRS